MRSQQTTRLDAMTTGVRYLARETLREPVKDAVKEALREEADVRADEEASRRGDPSSSRQHIDRESDESSGRSIGLLLVGLTAVTAVAYLTRKRGSESKQSTWSEFDGDSTHGTGRTEPTGPTSESGSSTVD
ncbi:hypothetical protein BRC79_10020 [Halobacteriales archaeon QH_8_67_27]|nr:MAG: hypothetical protein BRC79_10020 [Halobacteriales archaeon QH_8_67_27]